MFFVAGVATTKILVDKTNSAISCWPHLTLHAYTVTVQVKTGNAALRASVQEHNHSFRLSTLSDRMDAKQAEVKWNHDNDLVRWIELMEVPHRKHGRRRLVDQLDSLTAI